MKLQVIKVINTEDANEEAWFKYKQSHLYIVQINRKDGMGQMIEPIRDDLTIGLLPGHFMQEITEFEMEDI